MSDPYLYPGTSVLINRLGTKNAAVLRAFETAATAQRIAQGLPAISWTAEGFCSLHHHLFQDVFEWAGQIRIVNISKPGALFCRVSFIKRELNLRFEKLQLQDGLRGSSVQTFTSCLAEHLSELNAIHPFREGNGRTLRALMRTVGDKAGHKLAIERIDPKMWIEASKLSFSSGQTGLFHRIVGSCLNP